MDGRKFAAWAEIDLNVLSRNIEEISSPSQIIGVVKANAYGHGVIPISNHLISKGIKRLAVARIEEGIKLRQNNINTPILVLGAVLNDCFYDLIKCKLTPAIASVEQALILSDISDSLKTTTQIQIKIDTGLNRYGIRWDTAAEDIKEILRLSSLKIEGIFTHFASADICESDDFTHLQAKRFEKVLKAVNLSGYVRHVCNSPAALRFPQYHYDYVRVGGALYGAGFLEPILTLKSRLVMVKNLQKNETVGYGQTYKAEKRMKIGLISIGYADGLPRELSNKGEVLIQGKKCKILGRVSMDQTVISLDNISSPKIGEEVVLIGKQKNISIKLENVASQAGTIPYEILTGLTPRVERVYIHTDNYKQSASFTL